MKGKFFLVTVCFMFLLSSFAFPAEQWGILSGTVEDESGVGLPGVEVTVSGPSLMGTRTTLSNQKGDYRISQLNVGTGYTVLFTLKGFKTIELKDVRIELGKETSLPVILKFGEIVEKVVVIAEAPVVDPKSSTNQVNVSKEIVETLANDRQYQSIMEMMPGAIPGNNPAMLGASDAANIYQFDGMDAADPATKTWSSNQNFDNFEEMQVITQGATAEYGRGTGAVINVLTKSGSNQLHGTARLSISRVSWDAKAKTENINFEDATRYLNETRPAINLGGPIIKDHIWFFGSYERRNKWKPAVWYQTFEESLTQNPTGSGRGYYRGHYASAKLSFRFGNFSAMGLWSEDPITIPDLYKYTNSTYSVSGDTIIKKQGGWNLNGEISTNIGTKTYLVGRVALQRGKLSNISKVLTGVRYEADNGFAWGAGSTDYESKRNTDQFQLNANEFLETGFGYHDIKLGGEIYNMRLDQPINFVYPGGEVIDVDFEGNYTFRFLYDPAIKTAKEYGNTITFFLQDKWEVTKHLTLNLGLRTEKTNLKYDDKTTILKFKFGQQMAPRLGAVYAFGKNKLSVNWGKYFSMEGWWIVDNFQPVRFSRKEHIYLGPAYGFPNWQFLTDVWATAPSTLVSRDSNLKPQHMTEYGVGYDRILTKDLALSVSYTHRFWVNKVEDYDTTGHGQWHFKNETNFTVGDVSWGKTYRKYDAVIVTFKKNLGNSRFQFLMSYTWSKLKGFSASEGEDTWGDNPYANIRMFGYLPNDIRHMVKFYGSVIIPLDIILGVNVYWFSGSLYTNYVNLLYTDQAGTQTGFNGRYFTYLLDPLGTSGRLPANSRIDARVEKKFKIKKLLAISAYIDIFNVLNQQRAIAIDNEKGRAVLNSSGDIVITSPNPAFGKYTSWNAPLSFLVGAKVEW